MSKQYYVPGTIIGKGPLHNLATLLEEQGRQLVIHVREIANNEKYQHHKGMINARKREIAKVREVLDLLEQALDGTL